jgi:small conductance mechanosensitive channel
MFETIDQLLAGLSTPIRLLVFIAFSALAHLVVFLIRRGSALLGSDGKIEHQKLRSIITLTSSVLVFCVYFFALGLILRELGVSLTAYLASASVIGLAVGFGSQGVVQDVVTGLTFIFSDLFDVGDLVEISGQIGRVKGITMRFVELENALGARVFIPNRTVNNVINYPKGYIRCIADVTLIGDTAQREQMVAIANEHMGGIYQQYPGILISNPSIIGRFELDSKKEFLRMKFRLWPNRGQPIETTLVKELTAHLKTLDEKYQDWMISVYYEVEDKD